MVVVKLCLGSDIRRVSVPEPTTFDQFVQLVRSLYSQDERLANPSSDLLLQYIDEEGDNVDVTSDKELEEAFKYASQRTAPLRFNVSLEASMKAVQPPATQPVQPEPVPASPEPVLASSQPATVEEPKPAEHAPQQQQLPQPCCPPQPIRQPSNSCSRSYVPEQMVCQAQAYLSETALVQGAAPIINNLRCTLDSIAKSDEMVSAMRTIEQIPDRVGTFISTVIAAVTEEEKPTPKPRHCAVCDCCDRPIQGVRYKCAICPDYDLCEQCEPRSVSVHDAQHAFLKIRTPSVAYQRAVPLTPSATPAPTSPVSSDASAVAAPAQPVESLSSCFIADITIPDGMTLPVGVRVTKIWRLQNNGTVAWPEDTVLTHASGHILTPPSVDSIPIARPVAPGQTIDIAVELLVPRQAGRYGSVFVLKSASVGCTFGHRVWVDLIAAVPIRVETPVPQMHAPHPVAPLVQPLQQQQQQQQRAPSPQYPAQQRSQQRGWSEDIEKKARYLAEMGFSDMEANRRELARARGDVNRAVEYLVRFNRSA